MYKAMIDKDIPVLNSVMAVEAVLVHMTGVRQPKLQYLKEIKNGTLNYYSVEDDALHIDVDGDSATLTGRSRVNAAVYGGGRHTWCLQLQSTLVKRDGRWLLVESCASTY